MVGKVTTPNLANDSDGGQSGLHPTWLTTVMVGKVTTPSLANDSDGGQSDYTQPG